MSITNGPTARVLLESFRRFGYVVLPGLLDDGLVQRLRPEVDRWVDEGLRARSIACCADLPAGSGPPPLELELPAHGELIVYPALMQILVEIMGPPFVFHHLHSDRQVPGIAGKTWHHDLEPNSREDSALLMVHALHYLAGLEESVGSLVVLPGSHRESMAKTACFHLGTRSLPEEVVIDRLPPGSTVLLHSALLHARRPAPPGPRQRPRYFVDASYCQTGAFWRPVKPYWRYMLQRGRELHIDGGLWPELFAERHFSEFVRTP